MIFKSADVRRKAWFGLALRILSLGLLPFSLEKFKIFQVLPLVILIAAFLTSYTDQFTDLTSRVQLSPDSTIFHQLTWTVTIGFITGLIRFVVWNWFGKERCEARKSKIELNFDSGGEDPITVSKFSYRERNQVHIDTKPAVHIAEIKNFVVGVQDISKSLGGRLCIEENPTMQTNTAEEEVAGYFLEAHTSVLDCIMRGFSRTRWWAVVLGTLIAVAIFLEASPASYPLDTSLIEKVATPASGFLLQLDEWNFGLVIVVFLFALWSTLAALVGLFTYLVEQYFASRMHILFDKGGHRIRLVRRFVPLRLGANTTYLDEDKDLVHLCGLLFDMGKRTNAKLQFESLS